MLYTVDSMAHKLSSQFCLHMYKNLWDDFGPTFCYTSGNFGGAIKQVRKCPLFPLILSFYPRTCLLKFPSFTHYSALQYVVHITFGYVVSMKNLLAL